MTDRSRDRALAVFEVARSAFEPVHAQLLMLGRAPEVEGFVHATVGVLLIRCQTRCRPSERDGINLLGGLP
jgi:hypothetical protein